MKKTLLVLSFLLLGFVFLRDRGAFGQTQGSRDKTAVKLFYVYSDHGSPENHFIPSGWMGDTADITLIPDSTETPYSGPTCIKVIYNKKASGGARWAGVYWQEPADNWGLKPHAGFDLSGVRKLTFWARGKIGGEHIDQFKVGGIAGIYPDSASAVLGPVILTDAWQQFSIDLTGKNLSHIIGGFCWTANLDANPQGCTFYLDEIRYE